MPFQDDEHWQDYLEVKSAVLARDHRVCGDCQRPRASTIRRVAAGGRFDPATWRAVCQPCQLVEPAPADFTPPAKFRTGAGRGGRGARSDARDRFATAA